MENQEIKHYPNDHIARVMADSFKLIESAYDSKESLWPRCIGTGISALDEITGGIDETDLVVVSGLTGTGKTSFIVSILSLLIEAKTPVQHFMRQTDYEIKIKELKEFATTQKIPIIASLHLTQKYRMNPIQEMGNLLPFIDIALNLEKYSSYEKAHIENKIKINILRNSKLAVTTSIDVLFSPEYSTVSDYIDLPHKKS